MVYLGITNCILIILLIVQWYYYQEYRIFNPLGLKILIGLLVTGTIFIVFRNISLLTKSIFYWISGELIFISMNALLFRYRMKFVKTSWPGQKIQNRKNWHHSKKITLGTIIYKNHFLKKFAMSIEDIKRHILIYGQTGTGKSSFLMYFLKRFSRLYSKTPFTLFEFKGEYEPLTEHITDLQVLKPGYNFSINLFDKDIFSQDNYVEILFDSLKSCRILDNNADFSPQMEKVLVDVLRDTCNDSSFPNWNKFYRIMDKYVSNQKNSIPMLNQTIISIKNRLRRYSEGPLKAVFNNSSNCIKISDILKKNTIIDLGNLLKVGGSKQDLIFFSNLILKWIWETAMNRNPTDNLKHLTIFEDVSYIASKKMVELSKVSLYLEDIALLLRGKGEALISLSTSLDISKNIILNAGTKLFFKFNEKMDEIVHHIGLENEKSRNFRDIQTGMCIIKTYSQPNSFLLYTNHLQNYSILKVLKKWRKKILMKNSNLLKPNDISDQPGTPLISGASEKISSKDVQYLAEFEKYPSKNCSFLSSEEFKEVYINLQKKIKSIENFIFLDEFSNAFMVSEEIFRELQSLMETTSDMHWDFITLEKRFTRLSNLYEKKNSKITFDDCLIGLKIVKILFQYIFSDKTCDPRIDFPNFGRNLEERRITKEISMFILTFDHQSRSCFDFYTIGAENEEILKKFQQNCENGKKLKNIEPIYPQHHFITISKEIDVFQQLLTVIVGIILPNSPEISINTSKYTNLLKEFWKDITQYDGNVFKGFFLTNQGISAEQTLEAEKIRELSIEIKKKFKILFESQIISKDNIFLPELINKPAETGTNMIKELESVIQELIKIKSNSLEL